MRYTIPQEMDYEYLNDLIASGYEPFDWAAVYDYPPDIPPPELVEAWEKIWSAYDTFHSIIERKIGNTRLFPDDEFPELCYDSYEHYGTAG